VKKIVFITAPDAEYGFGLAGISQQCAADTEKAEALLKQATTEENGLVILDERLMGDATEESFREMEKGWQGVLLVLPAPERPGVVVEDYITRLMRRAIGYHVRVQL
jgi:V/A-type H+-transporting ATPase subunit F